MSKIQNNLTLKSSLIFLFLFCSGIVFAQNSRNTSDAYVDKNGVMRWGNTNAEVTGFGVNYTLPFSHAFRAAKVLNVSPEKAIDDDVYHFARLGLDLYRVHVWDVEISDSAGNLLENEHLKLFDYLLKKLKERGIKSILTPLAFTGSGYPESDSKENGITSYYGGKANCLINPDAIKAEERYLTMFMNHVNPYTGIAYKNDPDIIAFEICNEPHHQGTVEETKDFINRLAKTIRSTGCKKPIFYNMSHSIHLAEAYMDADVQGGTFQWYPSGLVNNHELKGNFLPHVDKYPIPFADNPKLRKMAKIAYELDAADIGRSYLYPAMARSFREAGIQVATQFAWDPDFLAYANTSYQTHYMNLAYAPQKALSLMIASEVFHTIPMYKSFGRYPSNNSFGDFKVDYDHDLAEMVGETKFIYTNTTTAVPASPQKLVQLAGFGNSSVVKYEGCGAYFLDKLSNGVWRLEVMPDAIWVRDPFEKANFNKEVTVINWKQWPMTINLPDLADNFNIFGLNENNELKVISKGKTFDILPGTYLLIKNGVVSDFKKDDKWKNGRLNEFVAPPESVKKTYVLHTPATAITAGNTYRVDARIVSEQEPESIQVTLFSKRPGPYLMFMKKVTGYDYAVTIPDSLVQQGFLNYYISVKVNSEISTFPSGQKGQPTDWDYADNNSYRVPVVYKTSPVYLFDAISDIDQMAKHFSYIFAARDWVSNSYMAPANENNKGVLMWNVDKLFNQDPEYKTREKIYDCSFNHYVGKKIADRIQDLPVMKELIFKGYALNDKPCKIQLALVMEDGSAYGDVITVDKNQNTYHLSLTSLKQVKYVLMPRPYPTFLPYYFDNKSASKFDLKNVESIQFSIGPGIPQNEFEEKHGVAIESVSLQ